MLNQKNLEPDTTEIITINLEISKQELAYLQALAALHQKEYPMFEMFLNGITEGFFRDLVFDAGNVRESLLNPTVILEEYGVGTE